MRVQPSARRYEASTLPAALLVAWEAGMAWLDGVGWPGTDQRVLALNRPRPARPWRGCRGWRS